ncbi:hypothetical protein [Trinickia sp. Y13]|uniref:hypothetical protein n=1 Tax=Trinickia sp. Y13 TaxID=2917807 RepID=UPI00240760A8|nr:hypothetical protein [Trinickia sp. Y13]MDG0023470.1 hypothetical protein [Trinickia sp. Y13]
MYRLDCRRQFERPGPSSIDTLHEGAANVSTVHRLLTQPLKMVLIVGGPIAKMAICNRGVAFQRRRRQVVLELPGDVGRCRVLLARLAGRPYVARVYVVATEELA